MPIGELNAPALASSLPGLQISRLPGLTAVSRDASLPPGPHHESKLRLTVIARTQLLQNAGRRSTSTGPLGSSLSLLVCLRTSQMDHAEEAAACAAMPSASFCSRADPPV
jgi:hypothetical protein